MASEEVVDRGDNLPVDPVEKLVEKDITPAAEPAKQLEAPKAEPAAKEEPVKPEPKKGDEALIPRERFNEAVRKEREKVEQAQARTQALEEQLGTKTLSEDITKAQTALKELIKQRNSLLGDGKLDEASGVDEKIIGLQEAIADRKAEDKVARAKEMAREEMRYDSTITRLEEQYPELNPDDEAYNQDMVDEIRVLMRGYQVEMGLNPAAAISRAAKRVFGEKVKEVKEVKEDTTAKDAALKRKTEATERNIDAAAKQPASTKDVGIDHDKVGGGLDAKSIMKMNFKEFAELGEDVLSRARGDTL